MYNMQNNFKILNKIYEMILYYHCLYIKIPKSHKYNLGEKITDTLVNFYLLIETINKEKDKSFFVNKIDLGIDKIRLLVRMAKDLKIISLKQYDIFCDMYFEMCNMIESWKKSF